jgi:TonB family protein
MNWAWYLIQVNIYIVIFYAFYKVFLSRETWFTLNRFYLLSAAALSFLIPFIKPEWIMPETARPAFSISAGQLEILMVEGKDAAASAFNWGAMISTVYVCGIIFFAALFIWRLIHLRLLIAANPAGMAFSFFGRKVIDRNLPGQHAIHSHEDVHIRQMHTADVVYFELLSIVLWCNPVIYFFKKSIKNIHEYLADEAAAESEGNKESYAMLLLCKAFNVDQSALTNSFFTQSLIKKRIIMLNKQRSTKTAILKYGLFLPLFAGMLLLSSAKISRNEEIKDLAERIPAPVPVLLDAASIAGSASTADARPVSQDTTKKRRQSKPAIITFTPSNQTSTKSDTGKVFAFTSIDRQPSFPGGMDKFYQYLGKSIKYPQEAKEKKVQGKVFLSYIVEKDGRLTEIEVRRSLGSGTDEEAVRVLKASPKWIPGISNNQPVRVKYNIPITFALSKNTEETDLNKAPVVTPHEGAQTKISITGPNNPIVYFDGVRTDLTEAKKVDPNTIESIQVIKDKAARDQYGEDGKNGVILITSKKVK